MYIETNFSSYWPTRLSDSASENKIQNKKGLQFLEMENDSVKIIAACQCVLNQMPFNKLLNFRHCKLPLKGTIIFQLPKIKLIQTIFAFDSKS